jgi:hypothetical protein
MLTPPTKTQKKRGTVVDKIRYTANMRRVVGAEGFEPPPAGLEPAILPSYTIPPVDNSLMKIKT